MFRPHGCVQGLAPRPEGCVLMPAGAGSRVQPPVTHPTANIASRPVQAARASPPGEHVGVFCLRWVSCERLGERTGLMSGCHRRTATCEFFQIPLYLTVTPRRPRLRKHGAAAFLMVTPGRASPSQLPARAQERCMLFVASLHGGWRTEGGEAGGGDGG